MKLCKKDDDKLLVALLEEHISRQFEFINSTKPPNLVGFEEE